MMALLQWKVVEMTPVVERDRVEELKGVKDEVAVVVRMLKIDMIMLLKTAIIILTARSKTAIMTETDFHFRHLKTLLWLTIRNKVKLYRFGLHLFLILILATLKRSVVK